MRAKNAPGFSAWHWLQRETSGGEERDAALRKLEDNTEHFSNDEKAQLLRGLGDVYSRAGNLKEAKRLWSITAALLPQDVQIRLTLFELALQERDDKAVSKLANEIKVLDSEGTVWRYTRANGLISMADKGNRQGLAEARRLLVEVSARRRLWSAPLRKLAAIDDLEGNPQQALENYEQALQLGDRDPLALRRVIQLLWTQQRFTEASQVLQRLDDQGTLSEEGRKARAWFLIQQGENETAIELARQAVANGATDLRDRVFLGQILWAAGEKHYPEAEKTLREATRMPGAEKAAEPWVVLVQFLAGTKHDPN